MKNETIETFEMPEESNRKVLRKRFESAEKINFLTEEVESHRKNALQREFEIAKLKMESTFRESRKELETNNLIVKFIKMELIPRAELLKAGATINDWSGIATLSGVHFKATFLNSNFFRVIQGAP